ncbi:gelsolin-like protein 1, partial [Exaiptasia diaphana]|uniref:Gelsolin-like domain-containing protein n=1 Tax=Exaiptasia diaphana TaxID=2652724 RepID=A0A913WVK9_EXADI
MAGLVKQKKYDWKDSNLAFFGSDLERNIKKESAGTEPAWEGAGQKPGLQIWRIVNFKVEHWPKEQYGKFFNGDSYIILNTYKDPNGDELLYDVHFWIGAQSTQDEYGTAAYKTVELDTLLDDKPVQHRQVQGFETDLFKSYFKRIQILHGGAESGFKAVGPEKYNTRLLEVKIETINGKKKEMVCEKPMKKSSMNNGDVYIIDKGLHIIMWCGQDASPFERNKGKEVAMALDEERNGKAKVEVLDDQD